MKELDSHMATKEGFYFNAWGSEGYGHYQLFEHIWLVGGWNYLEPRSRNSRTINYVLRYGVLGLRYIFKGFQRMVYVNARIDSSHLTDKDAAQALGDVYTIGMRWDFDW